MARLGNVDCEPHFFLNQLTQKARPLSPTVRHSGFADAGGRTVTRRVFDTFVAICVRANLQAGTVHQYFQGIEQDALDRQLTPITADYRRARVAEATHALTGSRQFDRR